MVIRIPLLLENMYKDRYLNPFSGEYYSAVKKTDMAKMEKQDMILGFNSGAVDIDNIPKWFLKTPIFADVENEVVLQFIDESCTIKTYGGDRRLKAWLKEVRQEPGKFLHDLAYGKDIYGVWSEYQVYKKGKTEEIAIQWCENSSLLYTLE